MEILNTISQRYKTVLTVIVLIVLVGIFTSAYLIQEAELKRAEEALMIKSDSEIITDKIISKGSDLIETNKEISRLESSKDTLELEIKCWKNQMNRLVDQLEYNLSYCKDKNNLSKFKEGLE